MAMRSSEAWQSQLYLWGPISNMRMMMIMMMMTFQ